MKIKLALASLPLVINACDSGDSDHVSNEPGFGIWEGGFSSSPITTSSASGAVSSEEQAKIEQPGVGLYTSDKRAFFYNYSTEILFTNDTPGIVSNTLYYSPDYYLSNGIAQTTVSFSGTTYNSTSILGNYNGDLSGNYVMLFDDRYFRGADLSRLTGSWSYTGPAADWSLVVVTDGSFTANSTIAAGCSGTGAFTTIDASKNEYAVSMSLNCGGYSGSYTGLAATVDQTLQNDRLIMAIYSNNGNYGFFLEPVKD